MAEKGYTRREMADQIGLSYNRITELCRNYGIKVVRKKRSKESLYRPSKYDSKKEEILKMRAAGMSYRDIERRTGIEYTAVGEICRKLGVNGSIIDQRNHEDQIIKKINDAGYDYLGGYSNSDGKVKIRCQACGYVFERCWHVIRDIANKKYKNSNECPGCKQLKAERIKAEQEAQKAAQREAQEREKRKEKQIKDSRKINDELMKRLATHVCKACGREYVIALTGYNSSTYCSETCQHRKYWDKHEKVRIKRMYSRPHNNDITLKKLYDRDNGQCYICGKTCDWNDRQAYHGIIAVGPTYPTIDHVKPLAKGGTHTWDNVKLCCKRCNEVKGVK